MVRESTGESWGAQKRVWQGLEMLLPPAAHPRGWDGEERGRGERGSTLFFLLVGAGGLISF